MEVFVERAVGPERVKRIIHQDLGVVLAAVDPNWAAWQVFQLLAEAGAPVVYLKGKIFGEEGSGCEVVHIRSEEHQIDRYEVTWITPPLPLLDDPDVIDLEVIEERPALPAGA